jgi:signal transduction histidine kinase
VLSVFLLVSLIVGYQLMLTLLAPPWEASVTGWFRASIAWPETIFLLLLSWWLTRIHRPEAPTWWLLSISMLGYAIGKTLLVVVDQFGSAQEIPFPWWSDVFYLITLPCFFLAPMLWPGVFAQHRHGLARAKVLLDTLLVMGAVTALSWYFFLAPLFMRSSATWLAKATGLAYPVADLGGCFALTVILLRLGFHAEDSAILRLLLVAAACLILADSWMIWLRLYAPSQAGALPDLLFLIASLLLPLAGLVQLRLAQRSSLDVAVHPVAQQGSPNPMRQDLIGAFRFLLPFIIVLLACIAIEARILVSPKLAPRELMSHLIILTLLLLVLARQGVAFLEHARTLREREAARANEQAMRETNRQMETFLGIVSHELKTPLSSMLLGLRMLQRRAETLARPEGSAAQENAGGMMPLSAPLELTWQQFGRLNRLVNDLVDNARIQGGQLEFYFQQEDLAAVVRPAVEEQRQLFPERVILFSQPDEAPLPVWCDAARVGQVVTNFLTNALKYSPEDGLVEVGVQAEGQQARVWVRDQGPGIPKSAQAQLWERFHRVPGIEVQCGSGVGLGLGLYISKMIIKHHDGQVGVESTLGQGSTFWFTLPLLEKQGNETVPPAS